MAARSLGNNPARSSVNRSKSGLNSMRVPAKSRAYMDSWRMTSMGSSSASNTKRCGLKPRAPNPKSMAAPWSNSASPRLKAPQDPPGWALRSSTPTESPRFAMRLAAVSPESPAPMTSASNCCMEPSFLGLEPTVPWGNGGMRLCNVRVVGALRSRQLRGGPGRDGEGAGGERVAGGRGLVVGGGRASACWQPVRFARRRRTRLDTLRRNASARYAKMLLQSSRRAPILLAL